MLGSIVAVVKVGVNDILCHLRIYFVTAYFSTPLNDICIYALP